MDGKLRIALMFAKMANRLRHFTSLLFSHSILRRLLSFDDPSEDQATAPASDPPLAPHFRPWVSSDSFLRRLLSAGASDGWKPEAQPQPPPPPPPPPPLELEQIRVDSSVDSPSVLDPVETHGSASSSAVSEPAEDTKGVSKLAQTVSLGVAAASIALFVNAPRRTEPGLLYDAHVAFVCLALFSSLSLSTYSILMPREQRAAWVQRRVMVIAIAFVLLAFVLRTFLALPVASFGAIWLLFFFGAGGVSLYLVLAWKLYGPIHGG